MCVWKLLSSKDRITILVSFAIWHSYWISLCMTNTFHWFWMFMAQTNWKELYHAHNASCMSTLMHHMTNVVILPISIIFFFQFTWNTIVLIVKEGMCLCVLLFWCLMNAALWITWNIHSITSLCQNPTLIWGHMLKSLWRDYSKLRGSREKIRFIF